MAGLLVLVVIILAVLDVQLSNYRHDRMPDDHGIAAGHGGTAQEVDHDRDPDHHRGGPGGVEEQRVLDSGAGG